MADGREESSTSSNDMGSGQFRMPYCIADGLAGKDERERNT